MNHSKINMTRLLGGLAAAALALGVAQSASASVLYDNGPINGGVDGWTINYGYAVADSFTLTNASDVTGVNFGAWNFPGETITSVDWAITTTSGSFPDGPSAAVTSAYQYTNGFGYDINADSFSTGGVSLAAGTYYLVLQNAVGSQGNPVYWDENDGPSTANENSVGQIGSQSFQIIGTSAVPEPATWAMMLVGFGGLGAAMRSARTRRGAVAA